MHRLLRLRLLSLTLLALCQGAAAAPAPGAPDAAFADGGSASVSVDGDIDAGPLVLQRDGLALLASTVTASGGVTALMLTRFRPDGRTDERFGTGGSVRPVFADGATTGSSLAKALALQRDGKILVGGSVDFGRGPLALLARFERDGRPDPGFGDGGRIVLTLGVGGVPYPEDAISQVVVQPDGRIVAAGQACDYGGCRTLLLRFEADGRPDPGFADGGRLALRVGESFDQPTGLALQGNGRVLVAGTSYIGGTYDVFVARIARNGSLDPSFAGDGIALYDSGGRDWAGRVALQPNGRLLVPAGAGPTARLLRFTAGGLLDPSFGGDGVVELALGGELYLADVAVQADGRIVVGGGTWAGGRQHLALFRLDPAGRPDPRFAGSGSVRVEAPAASDAVGGTIALQPDGGLLLAGAKGYSPYYLNELALFRYGAGALDLVPAPLAAEPRTGVPAGSVQAWDELVVEGLGAGVRAPLRIANGQYALNGGRFTRDEGWVRNGDRLQVRQTAAGTAQTTILTTLAIGGLRSPQSPRVLLGAPAVTVFASTTAP